MNELEQCSLKYGSRKAMCFWLDKRKTSPIDL